MGRVKSLQKKLPNELKAVAREEKLAVVAEKMVEQRKLDNDRYANANQVARREASDAIKRLAQVKNTQEIALHNIERANSAILQGANRDVEAAKRKVAALKA